VGVSSRSKHFQEDDYKKVTLFVQFTQLGTGDDASYRAAVRIEQTRTSRRGGTKKQSNINEAN
jgi:hypothetical protein